MSLFEKGRAKTGGRRKGVKDRIGTMFLEELAKDFEEHGPEVIRLARIERQNYRGDLPKEFEITDSRLEEISDGELDALIELASNAQLLSMLSAEKNRRQIENRLAYYKPYPKQAEFRAAKARERLLMAGNQLGETLAGGFEAAMHATGRYPDWKVSASIGRLSDGVAGLRAKLSGIPFKRFWSAALVRSGRARFRRMRLASWSRRAALPICWTLGALRIRGYLTHYAEVLPIWPREIPG